MARKKASASVPDPSSDNTKKNAKWTASDDEALLNELLKAKHAGQMTENGFKNKTYAAAAKKLEKIRKLGGAKTESNCKTRQKTVCDTFADNWRIAGI